MDGLEIALSPPYRKFEPFFLQMLYLWKFWIFSFSFRELRNICIYKVLWEKSVRIFRRVGENFANVNVYLKRPVISFWFTCIPDRICACNRRNSAARGVDRAHNRLLKTAWKVINFCRIRRDKMFIIMEQFGEKISEDHICIKHKMERKIGRSLWTSLYLSDSFPIPSMLVHYHLPFRLPI